ncbi:hypothetical protein ABK040_008367 [Willaertia magna]
MQENKNNNIINKDANNSTSNNSASINAENLSNNYMLNNLYFSNHSQQYTQPNSDYINYPQQPISSYVNNNLLLNNNNSEPQIPQNFLINSSQISGDIPQSNYNYNTMPSLINQHLNVNNHFNSYINNNYLPLPTQNNFPNNYNPLLNYNFEPNNMFTNFSLQNNNFVNQKINTNYNIPTKKIKLIDQQYKKMNTLFNKLPKELIFYIIDFLIGNNYKDDNFFLIMHYNKDLNDNIYSNKKEKKKSDKYYYNCIPPFENIKTLLNLIYCNKTFYQTIIGNNYTTDKTERTENKEWNDSHNYWLNKINFYEKYLYWIRTRYIDNLQLGQGDLTCEEIKEMCKIQTLIQKVERGLIKEEKDAINLEEILNDEEYDKIKIEKNTNKNLTKESIESVNENLLKRLKLLEFTKEEFIYKNNIFQYFYFKILILSLKLFKNFDTDNDNAWGVTYSDKSLFSEKYLNIYNDKDNNTDNLNNLPKYGAVVDEDLSWQNFISNTVTTNNNCNNELMKKLQNYCYIHFKNVTFFNNLHFPENIKFLSFSFLIDDMEKDKILLDDFTFNGVNYLRIGVMSDYDTIDSDFNCKILNNLLQLTKFPNLKHLVLYGFSIFDNLLESDLISQINTLEIANSYSEKKQLINFINQLKKNKQKFKNLKQVIIQLEIDSRRSTFNYLELKQYYNDLLSGVLTSIGFSTIMRYYYSCSE